METEQEFNRRVFAAHSDDITDEDLRRYLRKNITMASSVRGALIERLTPKEERASSKLANDLEEAIKWDQSGEDSWTLRNLLRIHGDVIIAALRGENHDPQKKAIELLGSSAPFARASKGLAGMSADAKDERILRLHFSETVSEETRKNVVDALNAWPIPADGERADG